MYILLKQYLSAEAHGQCSVNGSCHGTYCLYAQSSTPGPRPREAWVAERRKHPRSSLSLATNSLYVPSPFAGLSFRVFKMQVGPNQ